MRPSEDVLLPAVPAPAPDAALAAGEVSPTVPPGPVEPRETEVTARGSPPLYLLHRSFRR